MVEENVSMNTSTVVPTSDNELEEVIIPNSENTPTDNELDDVIPCETVVFEETVATDNFIDFSNDGFYDDVGYVQNTSIDQMVDISTNQSQSSDFELEEESTFSSNGDAVVGGLEDVVSIS